MVARVLIAEDEANIAELLQFLLQREGYETQMVFDGSAALAAAREAVPDAVVLDAMLPNLSGYEVLKALRADASLKAVPVLMLTAKGQDKDRKLAEDLGVNAFITKQFANNDVIACVARLLGEYRT